MPDKFKWDSGTGAGVSGLDADVFSAILSLLIFYHDLVIGDGSTPGDYLLLETGDYLLLE